MTKVCDCFIFVVNLKLKNMTEEQKSIYIEIIKLADKIINGDEETNGMCDCLDYYYNGDWNSDLLELEFLKQKVGL